jgi:alpha-L-fucosidase
VRRRDFLRQSTIPLALSVLPPSLRWSPPARPRPTAQQLAWHRNELSLFLHFGINTFTDREWGDGTEDPGLFHPAQLDARQWARVARSAGFKTLILTAKHHDGFCLWPSRFTEHSVRSSPWREGRGDVVREFTDACREAGLNAGLYLSPWDRHEPTYGDSPRYNDYYIGQLSELLTQYGTITEVWFDGANGEGPNGKKQVYDWPRIHSTVRRLAPTALIFSDAGPDLRWIGNEKGVAGEPNWCMVDPKAVPYAGADGPGIIDALQHGDPGGAVWRPGEADVSIRPGWFYHPAEDERVRSAIDLRELYFSSVGKNAGLLLNVPPNRDGVISAVDAARLADFGSLLRESFATDLAQSATLATDSSGRRGRGRQVIDGNLQSFWEMSQAVPEPWVQIEFAAPVEFNTILVEEAIQYGQCISSHRVEIDCDTGWTTIARCSTIGAKRLHQVPLTRATRVRLVIPSTLGTVRIARLGLFRMASPG